MNSLIVVNTIRPDWRITEADQICIKITKGTTPPASEIVSEQQIPFIRVNNLTQGGCVGLTSSLIYVSRTAHEGVLARSIAKPGDTLMNIVGPPLGKVALLTDEYTEYNLNQAIIIFRPDTNKVDPEFLYYFVSSYPTQQWLASRSKKTSGQQNLTIELCKQLPIPELPLIEQRKIAEILRNWDEAIDACERLIDSLERRFSATARRFFDPCHPTFDRRPQSWSEFELGDVFAERNESGDAGDRLLSITMSGGIIDRDDVGRKDTSTDDKSSYKLILAGDIGYNTMRMWQGVCGLSMLRGIVSPAYTIVTPDNVNIAAKYAAHLFKSRRMVFDFERYSQGLTSDTWNLKFPAFSKIKLFLPPIDIQHQQAELLDVLKGEIEVLYRKREALANQKRGLMQKLLTGQWRVKIDKEPSHG